MSSIPFDQLEAKEVLTFVPGQTVFIRALSVEYAPSLTGSTEDGTLIDKPGLVFKLASTFPSTRATQWRLWNKRSIGMFRPLIESGMMFKKWIKVTRTGQGVTSDYVPVETPEGFEPSETDVHGGPL